jgi:uncharacterized protein YbjT (DUF2867 family)
VILVAGATGQVGLGVVTRLRERGGDVAALVRPATDAAPVEATGARVVRGDLLDAVSLRAAARDADVIVATANMIVPRRGDRADFDALARGTVELARAAPDARFLFLSVPTAYMGRGAPDFDAKRRVEETLRGDGIALTVVRGSVFMDTWLPSLGSRLPVRGTTQPTVERGFWLTRLTGAQRSIDRFGVAVVPGNGRARHSFVAASDVAEALAAAALEPDERGEIQLAGPEALTWLDVARVYARVLGRRIRVVHQPVTPLRLASLALRRISPAASHLFAAQHLIATIDSVYPPDDTRRLLGREPTSVEEFLRARLAII